MASHNSIPPFPADIDRNAFGHWLSGFTDGEGCFFIGHRPKNQSYVTAFKMTLRGDDLGALQLIQRYWQCGTLRMIRPSASDPKKANPVADFTIVDAFHLSRVVVPHFNKYPLFAKKQRDFKIWSVAVELIAGIKRRPTRHAPYTKSGFAKKWTQAEKATFLSLLNELKACRLYAGNAEVTTASCLKIEHNLFSALG